METSGVSLLCKRFLQAGAHIAVGLTGSQRDGFQIGTPFCGFRTLVSALDVLAGKLQMELMREVTKQWGANTDFRYLS